MALAQGKSHAELMTGVPGPISAVEFAYWRAYHRIHPIGYERFDILFALQTYRLREVHAGKNDNSKPEDFLPTFKTTRKKRQS